MLSASGSLATAQRRPRNVRSRPAPSITVTCISIIVGKLLCSREELRAYLASHQYEEPLRSNASLDSLRNRAVVVTKAPEGMAAALRLLPFQTSIAMPMLVNVMFSADAEYIAAIAARWMTGQDPVEPPFSHRM